MSTVGRRLRHRRSLVAFVKDYGTFSDSFVIRFYILETSQTSSLTKSTEAVFQAVYSNASNMSGNDDVLAIVSQVNVPKYCSTYCH